MTYLLIVEGMTSAQHQEFDEFLLGPTPVQRQRRTAEIAAVGGEVVGSKAG